MQTSHFHESFVDSFVTYVIEIESKVYMVENVPARICLETGEKLFSPETVDHLQEIIWGQSQPIKIIETPIYSF